MCTLLYLAIRNMHCYVYLKYYITKVMYRNLLCKLALLALWYGKIQYHVTQACWVMNVTRHASQFISCTMMWNLGWAKFTEAPPTCTLAKNKKKVSIAFFSFCCRTSSRTVVKSVDIFRKYQEDWNIIEINLFIWIRKPIYLFVFYLLAQLDCDQWIVTHIWLR